MAQEGHPKWPDVIFLSVKVWGNSLQILSGWWMSHTIYKPWHRKEICKKFFQRGQNPDYICALYLWFFPPCQLNEFSFCAPREEPMFQQRPYLILCFGTKSSVLLAFNECLLIVPCLWKALGSIWSLHVLCTCKITGWICSIYNSRLAHGGFHLDQLSLFDQHKVWTLTFLSMSSYTSVFWCLGKDPESLKQTPKYEGLLSSCQRQIPPARALCDTVHTGQRALTSKEHRFKRKQMKLGTVTPSWRRAPLLSRGEKQSRFLSHPFWSRHH